MKHSKTPIAGMAILALSACMGSNDGLENSIVSSGLLELVLPDQASRDELPSALSNLIDDVQEENERVDVDASPAGNVIYDGDFALAFSEEETAIFGSSTVNVAVNGSDLTYSFEPQEIYGEEGDVAVSGGFSGSTTQTGGFFSGDLGGSIVVGKGSPEERGYSIDGTVNAVFGDNGTAFGELNGTATGSGNNDFSGVFLVFE